MLLLRGNTKRVAACRQAQLARFAATGQAGTNTRLWALLRPIFEQLRQDGQQMFLDVALFFHGRTRENLLAMWEARQGRAAAAELDVLAWWSLVEERGHRCAPAARFAWALGRQSADVHAMHGHVRSLGPYVGGFILALKYFSLWYRLHMHDTLRQLAQAIVHEKEVHLRSHISGLTATEIMDAPQVPSRARFACLLNRLCCGANYEPHHCCPFGVC